MKKSNIITIMFLIACMLLSSSIFSYGHSGGTDANGGHHVYDEYGNVIDYHYHHGMSAHYHNADGSCPYETNSSSSSVSNNVSVIYDEDDFQEEEEDDEGNPWIWILLAGGSFYGLYRYLTSDSSGSSINSGSSTANNSKIESSNNQTNISTSRNETNSNYYHTYTCPKCGYPMKKRYGKYGEFYGCIRYPNCRGTRPSK